jgi:hypothetical protein
MIRPRLPAGAFGDRLPAALAFGLALMPVALVAASLAGWLRHGVDLPWSDDWRALIAGQAGSLRPDYLFTPANGTLYPVGKVLDSLAQRLLGGNAVVYQAISMIAVLGVLLLVQWRLLRRAIGDPVLTAAAFSLLFLALRPDTYWGRQNLSFHQALPVVLILVALAIVQARRPRGAAYALAVGAVGVAAGLTYTSGAFGSLAAGLVLLLLSRYLDGPETGRRAFVGGAALAVAGALTSGLQLMAVDSAVRFAYPWQVDYWMYLLGKISQSLALPASQPLLSLVLAVGATLVALVVGIGLFRRLVKRHDRSAQTAALATIYLPLAAAITTYLLIVAGARTYHLYPAGDPSPLDVFVSGYPRFHYWWVTLIWPWVAAALLVAAGGRLGRRSEGATVPRRLASSALLAALLLNVAALAANAFDFSAFYVNMEGQRMANGRCLLFGMQRPPGPLCSGPGGERVDLGRAVAFGRWIDASFTRQLHLLPGSDAGIVLYSLAQAGVGSLETRNIDSLTATDEGYAVVAQDDPTIFIRTGDGQAMQACSTLQLVAQLRTSEALNVRSQAWFRPAADPRLQLARDSFPTEVGGWLEASFDVTSPTGFDDRVRFDPIVSGPVTIGDIVVSCRDWRT